MTTIERCPWCDKPLDEPVDTQVENADSFCRHCDRPLFWVPSNRPSIPSMIGAASDAETETIDESADPSKRKPALNGVKSNASAPCWQCGEPNQQVASKCHRCGAVIPPPVVEVEHSATVRSCCSPSGTPARRRIDVPAWFLVLVGVELIAVLIGLIVIAWW